MKAHRFITQSRRLVLTSLFLLGLGLATSACQQEEAKKAPPQYPSGTLDFVAPAGVGGGWDSTIRATAKTLADTKIVTTPIEVRNAPGAGGAVHLSTLQKQKDNAANNADIPPHMTTMTGVKYPVKGNNKRNKDEKHLNKRRCTNTFFCLFLQNGHPPLTLTLSSIAIK